jgi:hypothetical protein
MSFQQTQTQNQTYFVQVNDWQSFPSKAKHACIHIRINTYQVSSPHLPSCMNTYTHTYIHTYIHARCHNCTHNPKPRSVCGEHQHGHWAHAWFQFRHFPVRRSRYVICVCVCMYVRMYVCMRLCVCMYACMYVW